MRIALVQTNPVIGAFPANTEKILRFAEEAKSQGCELAVFPELAVSGYPPLDLLERRAFLDDHDRALMRLKQEAQGIALLLGAVTRNPAPCGKPLMNSALLIEDHEIIPCAHKRLLPTYDVFDEARYFEPARNSIAVDFAGQRLGVTICEDVWNDKELFPHPIYCTDPVQDLFDGPGPPPSLIINIAASPYNLGKSSMRHHILTHLAKRFSCPVLFVNQVGGQDSLVFDGTSLAMDARGRMVACADRFQEAMVVVETEALHNATLPENEPPPDDLTGVLSALTLGTRDYVVKCGFSRVVVGLSGGVDSAVCAAIAVRALGSDKVLGLAMPSPYSSAASLDDARTLAENLGIGFAVLPIHGILDAYRSTLSGLLGEVAGTLTEQNIQARIRGNLLMAVANKEKRLVLSTGNKSEMAVGYCTLYGDMSGGLAVISDVPKMMVYELARLINREREMIPERILEKPPSAELAPNQRDEDDLPPYPLLDPILEAYLEENLPVEAIIAKGFPAQVVRQVVQRVRANEYKRKQAPIGLKVTTKAFGYGRRYPVAENYQEGEG